MPPKPELILPASANCGEILQSTEGSFEAPHYPNYAYNLDCAWIIEVPPGYYIEVHFPASGIERRYMYYFVYIINEHLLNMAAKHNYVKTFKALYMF